MVRENDSPPKWYDDAALEYENELNAGRIDMKEFKRLMRDLNYELNEWYENKDYNDKY